MRHRLLVAIVALASTVTAACAHPFFPQYGAPTVGLTVTSSSVSVGLPVTFSVRATVYPGAGNLYIRNVRVDFGDGSSAELGATPGDVSHQYATTGTFVATATAVDTDGSEGRATLTVVVAARPRSVPSIGLTSSAIGPVAPGTTVIFVATVSIPGTSATDFIQSVRLDFGDGQAVDLGATPSAAGVPHLYSTVGTYTAVATATTTNGGVATASLTIIVR